MKVEIISIGFDGPNRVGKGTQGALMRRYLAEHNIPALIIRGDGQYKQIIRMEIPAVEYESDWQPWWLEYSESGTPYLHLEGMRLCVAEPELDCEQPGGGQEIWHSVCDNRSGLLINEGILAVIGPVEGFDNPPRGITLFLYERYPLGSLTYTLIDP